MSTSVKSGSMAVSFLTETRTSGYCFTQRGHFGMVLIARALPAVAKHFAAVGKPFDRAARTSCLVIRPPYRFPARSVAEILFSAISLAAAGLGVPWVEVAATGSVLPVLCSFLILRFGFSFGASVLLLGFTDVSIFTTTCPTLTVSPSPQALQFSDSGH